MVTRQTLAIILAVFMAIPIWAMPELVGTVASSQSASARGTDLVPGSTIFSGDTIAVGTPGGVRITLTGGAQIRLAENSEVRLLRAAKAVRLELSKGRMNFRSLPESPVEGLLGDATFRPAQNSPAVGAISFLNSNTVLLYAERGDWLIATAHDGKSLLLHEGTAREATLEAAPAADGYAQRPPSAAAGGGGALLILLIGILIVGGTLLAAFLLGESESGLECQQAINAVSPFKPCTPR